MGRRANPNTRMGGHPVRIGWREISADPNGNREQRRAARQDLIAHADARTRLGQAWKALADVKDAGMGELK